MNDKFLLIIPCSTEVDLQAFLHFLVPAQRAVLPELASSYDLGINVRRVLSKRDSHGQRLLTVIKQLLSQRLCSISSPAAHCLPLGWSPAGRTYKGDVFGTIPKSQCPVAVDLCENAWKVLGECFGFLSASSYAAVSFPRSCELGQRSSSWVRCLGNLWVPWQ